MWLTIQQRAISKNFQKILGSAHCRTYIYMYVCIVGTATKPKPSKHNSNEKD